MTFWNPKTWATKQAPHKTQTKSAVLGRDDALSRLLRFGSNGGETPTSALKLYNESTAVSVPVNMIASAFASLSPVLKMPNGKIENQHPILELLRSPSPFFDPILFFEMLAIEYLVTGEACIVALGSVNRPPLEIQPISARNITITQGNQGVAISIQISGDTLTGKYLLDLKKRVARYLDGSLREVKYIRGYSTKDNSLLRGQSPLVAASAEARQSILGNEHNVSLLEKGGRMSLLFHFKEDLNKDDFEVTKGRVRAQYGGARNAGEIGVTSGEQLEIHELGVNNKDMDFALLQSMARNVVAMQYKVPLVLMSTDAATFNNYGEGKMALYDDAVLPLADKLYAGIGALLLPRYGLDPSKVEITYDMDGITALAKRRNEELKLRKDLNLETHNELRSEIGRESIDNGDQVLVPANMVPLGTDLFTSDNISAPGNKKPPRVLRDMIEDDT